MVPDRSFQSINQDVFHYQCSKSSTSDEIQTVFEKAIERQRELERVDPGRRAIVFLDEAGLPSDAKESLKILHYYLDHPQVPGVWLTASPCDFAHSGWLRCLAVRLASLPSPTGRWTQPRATAPCKCSAPRLSPVTCLCWRAVACKWRTLCHPSRTAR